MTAINFAPTYRGIKGCQGLVHSGLTAASTYQTQYHAPLMAEYATIPNGRIVYVNDKGEFTPICPVNTEGHFHMPLLLSEGGAQTVHVPQTWRYGQEAPYRTAIPSPRPNVMALPLCVGYEFLSTEFEDTNYDYSTALTSISDPTVDNGYAVGVITPVTNVTEMCIGFVSQKPGKPRQYGDPATFAPDVPNPMLSVTGKNQPGLSFWGHPLPCGSVRNNI